MKNLHVEFDVPAVLATYAGLDAENIAHDVRRMLALFLYEHKRISLGKACEIGDMSQWEFADVNRRLGIPIHYSTVDFAEDMERLRDL